MVVKTKKVIRILVTEGEPARVDTILENSLIQGVDGEHSNTFGDNVKIIETFRGSEDDFFAHLNWQLSDELVRPPLTPEDENLARSAQPQSFRSRVMGEE